MLDDFISDQAIAYKIFKNSIIKNKLSHAYLINTNGYHKGFDFAKAFAKYLLCPNNETGSHECSVCHLIDNNSYSEFKVIEADGLWIKKEQTDELQEMFSMKSLSGRKVYIINGVENLNISASNSILKFLEEPEEGIVAILITDNIYKVLGTIVSRCQVINLNNVQVKSDDMLLNVGNQLYNDSDKINEFVNDSESINKIGHVIDFIEYLYSNKLDTLVYINKYWNDFFKGKDDYLFAFNIMIMFYSDVINYKMGKDIILSEFKSNIEKFSELDYNIINKILNLIMEVREDLYSNVNLNLLMDKFIIKMEAI
ncbi:MAG: DNA polymerase III subunit delta' C-terminal domain-containing protein [Bacilli bacterium]